ncbi:hypothetical protein, partial [Nakamurella sp.]|uniref:hypothetical protein n=1 Tax=Nakamurella sp. TaxID=1869182 RepID=UPI003B3B5AFF
DLGRTPPDEAVAALVAAGVAVRSAAPRNRLEDVFLAMVDASGAAGSSSDHPLAPDGAAGSPPPADGDRTPVPSQPGGQAS